MRHNFTKYFEQRTRPNGSEFWAKTDDCPDELDALVFRIHNDIFWGAWPDDHIYQEIASAFEELEENEYDDLTIENEPRYSALLTWVKESVGANCCQEVLDLGEADGSNFWNTVETANRWFKEQIYLAVNEFIEYHEENNE